MMIAQEVREKFLNFFKEKGHTVVPSSSLVPDDPSVLLTTAGMQQFKAYFSGKADPMKDFGSLDTASIQKSFRTSDIDEVGDESHLTFFEMLGNFSFGGYFKKEAITWAHEFITRDLGLTIDHVSIFGGGDKAEQNIPYDEESEKIWKSLDATDIHTGGFKDNFWGPAGSEGPCGPANEVYTCQLEVATLVFMEYYCAQDQSLSSLPQKGVDVGWGFERLLVAVQKKDNIFETDIFAPLMSEMPHEMPLRIQRIIADHIRATTFLLADGVRPSNKEAGYILRRLMRRAITHAKKHGTPPDFLEKLIQIVIKNFGDMYSELGSNQKKILTAFGEENDRFDKTISQGMKKLEKMLVVSRTISGTDVFDLYQSYGLPPDFIRDLLKEKGAPEFQQGEFDDALQAHQEKSRQGQEKKFGGHGLLLDTGELKAGNEEEAKKVTRLHTATHLLQAALRKILGAEVKQMGSDITAERTRFDFSFSRKLTHQERKDIERIVNEVITKNCPVIMEEMSYEEAIRSGALAFFKEKYPDRVTVYTVCPSEKDPQKFFSREVCGGPHVKNTGEVGRIEIKKEEAVGAGARRIRAVLV